MPPPTAPEGVAARLDELERLHAEATPGPWGTPVAPTWIHRAEALGHVGSTEHAEDAALIVAAVNALPDLIAAVRAVAELAESRYREAWETWSATIQPGDHERGPSVESRIAWARVNEALDTQKALHAALTSALSGRDDHTEEAGR